MSDVRSSNQDTWQRRALDLAGELSKWILYCDMTGTDPGAGILLTSREVLSRPVPSVETPDRTPASERQPIPVTEIIDALQREGWVAAADGLKEVKDWETRTLMCRIDSRPSEVVGAVNGPDRTP